MTDQYTAARNLERKLESLKTARYDTIQRYATEHPGALQMLHARGIISDDEMRLAKLLGVTEDGPVSE